MHAIYKSAFPLLCFILLFENFIEAQELRHVQGDIIIQVASDRNAQTVISKFEVFNQRQTSIKAQKISQYPMNLWLVNVDHNTVNENNILAKLRRDRDVITAQKNHLIQYRIIPNDPQFIQQWQFINDGSNGGILDADLDIELAWDIATGGVTITGDTIVACVIDDGLDGDHEDLGDNLWINRQEIPDNGIDDDLNGYIDDIHGWNTYNDNGNVLTGGGHGTPVAGIVGAQGNNGIGVSGVNWDVKLMIVQGGGNEANALASYAYPYYFRKMYNLTNGAEGAFVVSTNASWGTDFGQPEDAPLWCAMYDSLGQVGIISCGATINGNQNVDEVGDLPTACSSNYLISVTNIDRSDSKVLGAGFGMKSIDLGAFGEDAWTIDAPNTYRGFGGTSGATPHVTGTVALAYSVGCSEFMAISKSNPGAAALMVKDYILNGVDPNADLMGITTTGGRLNVFHTMENALEPCASCATATGINVVATDDLGISISWVDRSNTGTVDIRYRKEEDTEWNLIENISSPYNMGNLDFCTFYELQVRTNCNPDAEFKYSRFVQTEGCCKSPNSLNVEINNGEALLTWNGDSQATSYELEIMDSETNEWVNYPISDDSFVFSDLMECTAFEARVRVICGNIPNESEFSEVVSFNGPCGSCSKDGYCAFDGKDNGDEWIQSLVFGDLYNESGADTDGYGNYIGSFSTIVNQGDSVAVILTPGYASTIYDEYFRIYVDWDQDEIFNEEEELTFDSEGLVTEAVSGMAYVPEDALLGITRMRVVMRFDAEGFACDQAGFQFGEIEDYCVEVREPLYINEIPPSLQNISVQPNPFSDKIEVTHPDQFLEVSQWEILDIQGKHIMKSAVFKAEHSLNIQNLESLQSGIYFLKLSNDMGSVSKKIVKL